MDAKGRFFYKGHPPCGVWKPFPCDIGLEAYFRKHPIFDNQRSGRHYWYLWWIVIMPFLVGVPLHARRFNRIDRQIHGVNAHYFGWQPPYEYNATENPLPIWDNPVYEKWLKKQEHIREMQGDKALPRFVTIKQQ
eukprot:CAMPEP_0202686752 /NCGR_PEP_ID=MMETSP1385-20130828/2516_1 /ASSEMBLY_ACC=CAM_ASM_000861 /TAXON_ID=933848 /ORGANISM="Elphidium margaritaceum" /LENGTH=134 /DNA_ID=CAMNT_0049341399 /DNA_START=33 /DNA_END=437 /DNA_ORIENTATION=-